MTGSTAWSARLASKLLPLLPVLLAGCVAEVGGGSAGSATGGQPVTDPGPVGTTPMSCNSLGSTRLARLAREEYLNTVAALLQIEAPAATALPEDGDFGGFKTTAGQTLSAPLAEKYVDAAEAISAAVLLQQERVFACAGRDETVCMNEFLATMGPKLFRRPLRETETQHYQALFSTARATATFEQAASVMLQALLLAPQFLFHIEERPAGLVEGQPFALDDFQLAARLSYLFWRSTPDQELAGLAAQGSLRDPAVLKAQTERLMNDERTRAVTRSMLSQWLRLENIERIMVDPVKEPAFTPALLSSLAQETRTFVEQAFWTSSDTVRELLLSKTRFRNQTLSQFYGDTLGSGESLVPVLAEPDEKAFGLLSQAGFLAAVSRNQDADIIYRGRFIRERLLCAPLALPPPNVASPLPEFTPGMTGRQRVAEHTSGAGCIGCHQLMNPLGFALERFDYLGRWRDQDAGQPIDSVSSIDDELGQVSGARELSQKLSESEAVALCGAQKVFEFALGRAPDAEDGCVFQAIVASRPRDLRGVLASIPMSRAFQFRVEPQP